MQVNIPVPSPGDVLRVLIAAVLGAVLAVAAIDHRAAPKPPAPAPVPVPTPTPEPPKPTPKPFPSTGLVPAEVGRNA